MLTGLARQACNARHAPCVRLVLAVGASGAGVGVRLTRHGGAAETPCRALHAHACARAVLVLPGVARGAARGTRACLVLAQVAAQAGSLRASWLVVACGARGTLGGRLRRGVCAAIAGAAAGGACGSLRLALGACSATGLPAARGKPARGARITRGRTACVISAIGASCALGAHSEAYVRGIAARCARGTRDLALRSLELTRGALDAVRLPSDGRVLAFCASHAASLPFVCLVLASKALHAASLPMFHAEVARRAVAAVVDPSGAEERAAVRAGVAERAAGVPRVVVVLPTATCASLAAASAVASTTQAVRPNAACAALLACCLGPKQLELTSVAVLAVARGALAEGHVAVAALGTTLACGIPGALFYLVSPVCTFRARPRRCQPTAGHDTSSGTRAA